MFIEQLNFNFISGFIDAEGCFHISIVNSKSNKIGKSVRTIFQISLHKKDRNLLLMIKNYFGVGKVLDRGGNAYYYQVTSVEDLKVIIKHLEKYPLITQKRADFELFKQAVNLVINKNHLTKEGLANIVNIKASMNFGVLSDSMQTEFPIINPIQRPVIPVDCNKRIDPYWLSGFTEGEGCFYVNIYKRIDSVLGVGVKLVFKITQDQRNKELLELFPSVLGCGKLYNQNSKGGVIDYMVTGLGDIVNKIIPFFIAHPLRGAKLKEYQDFVKVAKLMENKAHLTKDGLEEIRSIKLGMNFKRDFK